LETILGFIELDMAELIEKEFKFTVSLLDATIQDGSIKERDTVLINFQDKAGTV